MRSVLIFALLVVVYYAVRTVVRSAVRAYHENARRRLVQGEDMVLDPQCRTYVPKGRAVARRSRDIVTYFCSEACADEYAGKNRN